MNFKKVIFLPDPKAAHTEEVKTILSKDFSCFESRNSDEYSQVFFQTGPFVLLFSDAKSALALLKNEAQALSELKFKTYLYLGVNGSFNAEAQKKLKDNRINVYPLSDKAKLISSISDFMQGKDDESIAIEDIQFIMPEDD